MLFGKKIATWSVERADHRTDDDPDAEKKVDDMESANSSMSAMQQATSEAMAAFLGYAPSLVTALAVLLVGRLLARLARGAMRRLGGGINRLLDRAFRQGPLADARLSPAGTALLSEVLFWIILFLTLTIAARVAQLPAISAWLNQIAIHLPGLLIGAGIIVAGYFISAIVGKEIASSARSAKATRSALIGRLAQSAIFITALIVGLDQMGVDVTFLVALFVVSSGAIFVGFSIAFGLGARVHVSNLIGARSARQQLVTGVRVRIGDWEGEVLEITPTQIALDTTDGRALVPARMAEEDGVLIVSRDAPEGADDG